MNDKHETCRHCTMQTKATDTPCEECNESPVSTPPASGKGRTAARLIAVMLAVGAVLIGGSQFLGKPLSPDHVVAKYITAQRQENVNKILRYTSQADIDALGGEDAARSMLSTNISRLSGRSAYLHPRTGEVTYENENTAIVPIVYDTASLPQQTRELIKGGFKPAMVTVRENGKWKVSNRLSQERMAQQVTKIRAKQMEKKR